MTVAINGTTGIDLIKDGTVSQADLGPNVAGNGPCFSVYQSTPTSLASGVVTKIGFQTKLFDTHNCFDAVTNSRFQPTVPGYYQLTLGLQFGAAAASTASWLFKNGAGLLQLSNSSPSPVSQCTGTALVYLNGSTDYVEFWVQQSSATQNSLASSQTTYFQGYLARSA